MPRLNRVAVIGGGIIGVSSALRILETTPGVEVTLIAEKLSPNTTGDGSAGFWFPYLLGKTSPELIRFWCETTFKFLSDIFKSREAKDYGVGILPTYDLSETPKETPDYSDVFLQYRDMSKRELDLFPSKYRYGVFFVTLFAECKKLIPKLMAKFQRMGGKIIPKRIKSLDELSDTYDVVINCSGVEAAKLVSDPKVFPIRGQVMRVKAPWLKFAIIAGDYYILPNSEEVICGGTHQEGNWSREIDPIDKDIIWTGCLSLVPSLKHAEVIEEWVGLRPGRYTPRIERETLHTKNGKLEVIHNYGHGGSGVTVFWGCALQVTNLLQEALSNIPSRAKL